MKEKKVFRCFVTRHYIEAKCLDVIAMSARQAQREAEKAAYKAFPDVRATATDNGWHSDDATVIPYVGSYGDAQHRKIHPAQEIHKNVFLI